MESSNSSKSDKLVIDEQVVEKDDKVMESQEGGKLFLISIDAFFILLTLCLISPVHRHLSAKRCTSPSGNCTFWLKGAVPRRESAPFSQKVQMNWAN